MPMCTGSARYVESRSRNRNPNLHGDLSGGSLETVFHTSCVDSTCILEDDAHAHLAILESLVLCRVVFKGRLHRLLDDSVGSVESC